MTRKSARMQQSPLTEHSAAPANPARTHEEARAYDGASRDVGEEQIRTLAHQIFECRCRDGTPGDERSDWLEAERQLRTR